MKKIIFALTFIIHLNFLSAQTINLGPISNFKDLDGDGIISLAEIKLQYFSSEKIYAKPGQTQETRDVNLYWSEIAHGGPLPSENGAMAFYKEKGVVVLFGGHYIDPDYGDTYINETWELILETWVQNVTASSPPEREGHSLAYDPERKRVILFGGRQFDTYYNDTWEYDGLNWYPINTANSPSPRMNFLLTYCPQLKKIVLFGGRKVISPDKPFGESYSDTWAYDGQDWVELFPQHHPSPRAYPMGDWDSIYKSIYLFGGLYEWQDTIQFSQDTWLFDGNDWYQQYTKYYATFQFDDMKYDPNRRIFVGFGCANPYVPQGDNQTWEFKSGEWYKRNPLTPPPTRLNSRLAYHELNGGIVLFGGFKVEDIELKYLNDTYVLRGPSFGEGGMWTFEESQENWGFFTPTGSVEGYWEPGHLCFDLKGNQNVFGFWASPSTTVIFGRLYRARYIISTDIQNSVKFPIIRLRCNSADGTFSAFSSITSLESGALSPTPGSPQNYDLYFSPSTTAHLYGMIFSVDVINIDPNDANSGKINIEEVQLESIPVPNFD